MTKRILVLVEGQTEETFVRDTLSPHFYQFNIFLQPTLITTKVVKSGPNFKGGIMSYEKVKNDILRLLKDTNAAAVTTMIDYYGLPDKFPGVTLVDKMARTCQKKWHTSNKSLNEILPILVLSLMCSYTNLKR